jgi:hypothetical protein
LHWSVQLPAAQSCDAWHFMPHPPQLLVSFAVSVHVLPHRVCCAPHGEGMPPSSLEGGGGPPSISIGAVAQPAARTSAVRMEARNMTGSLLLLGLPPAKLGNSIRPSMAVPEGTYVSVPRAGRERRQTPCTCTGNDRLVVVPIRTLVLALGTTCLSSFRRRAGRRGCSPST